MGKTKQELAFEVGQRAVECSNAAAHFCFNRLDSDVYHENLIACAGAYVDAVQALEAMVLDEEREASPLQAVPLAGSSDEVPDGSDSGSAGSLEQLQLPLVYRGEE